LFVMKQRVKESRSPIGKKTGRIKVKKNNVVKTAKIKWIGEKRCETCTAHEEETPTKKESPSESSDTCTIEGGGDCNVLSEVTKRRKGRETKS